MRTHGLKFDVNCSILFTELPLLARPEAARSAGFDAVEFWWPFAEPVPADRDVDAFTGALNDAGVQLVLLNFAAGDMAAGDRGLVCDPARSTEFRDSIEVCTGIAARTGCRVLNALYGNASGADGAGGRPGQHELAIENLVLAAGSAAKAGATVVIEPLNSTENPRYPLNSSHAAIEVIDALRARGAPDTGLLADLYHLAMMGEDLVTVLESPYVSHIQIADVPGRGAPGTGTVDFEAVFSQLAVQCYPGYVGCEYRHNDTGTSIANFAWRQG